MATPCNRTGSGQVTIKRELSNLCFRGSHENSNGIRKCVNAWGKCECECHLGENNG
ncbi:MAG: hypothetical protein AABY15_04030 [Nanoarchaeota archaeon]